MMDIIKDLKEPIDKRIFTEVLEAVREMAKDSSNEYIQEAIAPIELCMATVEDKNVGIVANVALTLLLTLPVNVLEGFKGVVPEIINQKIMKEYTNLLNNLKDNNKNE